MKKFLLILVVLAFSISPVYAGNIPQYNDQYEQDKWEQEQQMRNLRNRQQILEEKYNTDNSRRTPGDKLNDSLKLNNLDGGNNGNRFQQR